MPISVRTDCCQVCRGRLKAESFDILCIRENTEGEYSGAGGRVHQGMDNEVAVETSIFTRKGVERILRFGFEQARARSGKLASVTKSNAQKYSMVFWDEITHKLAAEYPDVEVTSYHVDAIAARMVMAPESLDVVVASNLFGDILTDLGAAIQGGLGFAASANINPDRSAPSMFEPVHGSAPDIAHLGIANPIAAIWSGAMMLDHLGERDAASRIMKALEDDHSARHRHPSRPGQDGCHHGCGNCRTFLIFPISLMSGRNPMQTLKDKSLFREAGLIGGKWVEAGAGKTVDVIDPATQAIIGTVPDMGGEETAPPSRRLRLRYEKLEEENQCRARSASGSLV